MPLWTGHCVWLCVPGACVCESASTNAFCIIENVCRISIVTRTRRRRRKKRRKKAKKNDSSIFGRRPIEWPITMLKIFRSIENSFSPNQRKHYGDLLNDDHVFIESGCAGHLCRSDISRSRQASGASARCRKHVFLIAFYKWWDIECEQIYMWSKVRAKQVNFACELCIHRFRLFHTRIERKERWDVGERMRRWNIAWKLKIKRLFLRNNNSEDVNEEEEEEDHEPYFSIFFFVLPLSC